MKVFCIILLVCFFYVPQGFPEYETDQWEITQESPAPTQPPKEPMFRSSTVVITGEKDQTPDSLYLETEEDIAEEEKPYLQSSWD